MTKEELVRIMEKEISGNTGATVEREIVSGNITLEIEGNPLTFFYDKSGNLYKVSYGNWIEAVSWVKDLEKVLDEDNKIDFKNCDTSLVISIHNNSMFTMSIIASSFNTINSIVNIFKRSRYRDELKEHVKLLEDYAVKLNSLKSSEKLKSLIEKVRTEFGICSNI